MNIINNLYHDLLSKILDKGYWYEDRKRKVKCLQIPSDRLEISLDDFPAITTKSLFFKGIVGELLWFLKGANNIKYLIDNNINIWNKDAYNWYLLNSTKPKKDIDTFIQCIKNDIFVDEECKGDYCFGDVGRNYGMQWRKWLNFNHINGIPNWVGEIDQIERLICGLENHPINRRHIVTAWNPAEINNTALPPCHWSFEIIPQPIENGYGFTLQWFQRSTDVFLGLPFNISSYALLAHIIGKITNMKPLYLIGNISNVHIYENHLEAVKTQLERDPNKYGPPILNISDNCEKIFKNYHKGIISLNQVFKQLKISDFTFLEYQSYGKIQADMLEPKF